MLSLQVSLSDNSDSVSRTVEFDEDHTWLDIILACADVISAKYGYDITQNMKFITDTTIWTDRGHDHAIPKAAWEAFLGREGQEQEEFDFNDFDKELEEMRKWS
jgi:hypothetical protein